MIDQDLNKTLAQQEMIYVQLVSELQELDELLRRLGFPYGIDSLKTVSQELLENNEID